MEQSSIASIKNWVLRNKFKSCAIALVIVFSTPGSVESAKFAYGDNFKLKETATGDIISIHGFSRVAFGTFLSSAQVNLDIDNKLKAFGLNATLADPLADAATILSLPGDFIGGFAGGFLRVATDPTDRKQPELKRENRGDLRLQS